MQTDSITGTAEQSESWGVGAETGRREKEWDLWGNI